MERGKNEMYTGDPSVNNPKLPFGPPNKLHTTKLYTRLVYHERKQTHVGTLR
jgi:hypothetical protein